MLVTFILVISAVVLTHVAIFPKSKGVMRPIKITLEHNKWERSKRP